jgi:sarcosine oxidase, subunit beta
MPGSVSPLPDSAEIIGEATGVSRFLYATGFSGHGFLQSPAIGEILRDLVFAARRSSTGRR